MQPVSNIMLSADAFDVRTRMVLKESGLVKKGVKLKHPLEQKKLKQENEVKKLRRGDAAAIESL